MTVNRILLCAAALALSSFPAIAAAELWQGSIGGLPVVVSLDGDTDIDGQYFYRKHLLDQRLQGRRDDDAHLHLRVETRDGEVTERWELWPKGRDLLGQWQGGKGKKLPIQLHKVDIAALRAGADGARYRRGVDDGYEALRIGALELKSGKRETFAGHRLQWWVEPRSGIDLFQVESGYDVATLARINAVLRERQWKSVASYFQCKSFEMGEYEQTTIPRYMDERVLSVSLFTSYDCGGAHPDFGDSPLNLDVRSGRELELEDVLWLGKGRPPRPNDDDRAEYQRWSGYRDDTLAPWLVATLSKLYPAEMAAPKADQGCDYRELSDWNLPSWHLRPEGLYVGPIFARVGRACEYPQWPVIPWKLVEAHAGAALKD
ncbi:hypothetical protein [Lysobacter sp. Hz 25]|uniref:hypothetical protein n=1 Tax=Lysobacter sp. Hz 25 TaxID=3383698 RepID=UPI0038D51421